VIVLLLAVAWLVQWRIDRRAAARQRREEEEAKAAFDPTAGGFPVPPMPGQRPVLASRRSTAGSTIVQERTDTPPAQEAIDG
jgi:NADH-quinone oxidoreductase subunit H